MWWSIEYSASDLALYIYVTWAKVSLVLQHQVEIWGGHARHHGSVLGGLVGSHEGVQAGIEVDFVASVDPLPSFLSFYSGI